MTKRIPHGAVVCGVDGSSCSNAALLAAADLAGREHRALALVHAFEPSRVVDADRWRRQPGNDLALATLSRQEADTVLKDAALVVRGHAPDVEVVTTLREGDAREVMLAAAEDASVVVVGCRGRGGFARLPIGSVTLWLSQHSPCPTLVVRPREEGDPAAPVVVGTDATDTSAAALEFAFAQASFQGRPLVVVHCFDEHFQGGYGLTSIPDEDLEGLPTERLAIAEATAGLREKYPDVDVRIELGRGPAGPYLVRASEHAELLVVGSKQLSSFAALVLGAVSRSVVEHAACSVAVVPVSR
ncbi:universal stress protein [Nocardioides guangzhouensis]|uniref:Universal stress protein n=1 Tax=Nocardioides guangzhouensis TaxID=2497878 RepID=A0A4Q4Z5S2_9ACTN|nr:universal stress protein [Nocardioides guangzhouensis]RYP82685.1 universal stress protein [Nocardioides guangzhouensis]